MMDTPDIGSIVSMIMSNPALVEQISGMVSSAKEADHTAEEVAPSQNEEGVTRDEPSGIPNERRIHRVKLANAMKPYLSEERRRAIDAMMSIADILDITREKK